MTTQILNNFVRGKLDKDLSGRFDLPVFTNGFVACENFLSNYKGNLKNRTGFLYESQTKENKPARIIQFKFNTEQAYLIEFIDGYARFYTYDSKGNFGYVTDAEGRIVEIETGIPYENAKYIQYTQNADVMYITAIGIQPKKLTRLSATSFQLENVMLSSIVWSDIGYPSSCTFYKGRLWFAGFSKKPTTIKASKVANYENFTIPTSNIKDDDALSLTLTDIADPIAWIRGGKKNLIVGNSEGISIVNGGSTDEPITSTRVNADLSNKEGCSIAVPTEKDGKMIYVSLDKTKCFAFDYDLVSESFVSQNLNVISSELGNIVELYYKRDNNNLIYCRTENNQLLCLLYNKDENIVGWFPLYTNGDVVSICTITNPKGIEDLFICVKRHNNYYIERLAPEVDFTDYYKTDFTKDPDKKRFQQIQLEESKSCVYLDNSVVIANKHTEEITLNGEYLTSTSNVFNEDMVEHSIIYKTDNGMQQGEMKIIEYISPTEVRVEVLTESINPLTWNKWYLTLNTVFDLEDLEGEVQSVVADGGYIGEFVVQDGRIVLPEEYTTVVVGDKYTALAKTFNIGFYQNGISGQTMKKRINEFCLRFVNSAGFKIGTTLDNLQSVQLFDPNGYYDTIPLLMNGDEFIYGYNDLHDKEKYIYLLQDEPLPANITLVEYKIVYEALQ